MSSPMSGSGLPYETKSYVCNHIFDRTRDVLYVTHSDADWCFLCGGDDHPQGDHVPLAFFVVGMGHVIDHDPSLVEVLDLGVNEEAERVAAGSNWVRGPMEPEE